MELGLDIFKFFFSDFSSFKVFFFSYIFREKINVVSGPGGKGGKGGQKRKKTTGFFFSCHAFSLSRSLI